MNRISKSLFDHSWCPCILITKLLPRCLIADLEWLYMRLSVRLLSLLKVDGYDLCDTSRALLTELLACRVTCILLSSFNIINT